MPLPPASISASAARGHAEVYVADIADGNQVKKMTAAILERFGRIGFVAFYLAAGVVATLVQVIADPSSTIPIIGASGAIAGVLGDRLKVRVAAPPEGGRANAAIAELLAEACGVPPRAVTLESGAAQPQKCFRVRGVDPARVAAIG